MTTVRYGHTATLLPSAQVLVAGGCCGTTGALTASEIYTYGADLSITKTDSPDPVAVGSSLTYTVTVTNNGPNTATGVTMNDALPSGVTFVSAIPTQGSCSGTSTVTCSLGTIAKAAGATVTIIVTAPTTTGTISNTAVVSGNETDPNTANNSATASTTVVSPNHPPVANTGPNQTVEATSSSGASVMLNGSGSSDPDGDPLTYHWIGPFGTASGVSPTVTLPLGTNTVTLTVSDGQATATAAVVITVRDTTPPVIAAHVDVTAEATNGAGAVVTYISPATSDAVDGAGVATCLPASGSTFALGNTAVTCNAADAHGNAAAPTTFVMHVRDTTPPTITVTQNPLPNANGWNKTDVTITFTATDAVSTATCSPASVIVSAEGANQSVNTTCTDVSGNSATASRKVHIDKTPPVITTAFSIVSNPTGGTNRTIVAAFTCSDTLSGIASCPASVTVSSGGGLLQALNATATDKAGNSSTVGCNLLTQFIAMVKAASGTTLTITQANQLIAAANQLKAVLRCP